MTRRSRYLAFFVWALLGVLPATASAQSTVRAEIDRQVDLRLKEKWDLALADVARQSGLTISDGRLSGTRAQKEAAYKQVLERLQDDSDLLKLFTRAYVQSLVDEHVESRMPTSQNASSTNPATAGLTERSGSTSLAALTADLSNLVSADKTAISLNLNALAFVSMSDGEVYSELANYQRHDLARRFSGTVIFGAKIPEQAITGLSNLPDFDKVFDAFSWDVKVRVLGDKDPRSARWSPLTVIRGGYLVQKSALLTTFVGSTPRAGESELQALEDATILRNLLAPQLAMNIAAIKTRIARSAQLSIKAAGTHLTKETGKNKYAFAALFDVGLGPADVTANAQYAVTNDIRLGIANLFDTKVWTVSGDATSHLAPDSIVGGRTLDWSVGASANIFADKSSLPVPVKNTWKLFTKLEIPIRGGGKIPVSVIYSNDPNAIVKERFVTGQVGISYDFSAIKQLFTSPTP